MAAAGVEGVEVRRGGRTEAGGVAVGQDLTVAEEDPVALPVGGGHGRGDGAVPRGAEVGGVAEGVHVPGRGHEPVAVAAGVGHDRDRGTRAAADARARPGEVGVTEGEDPAVGGHHEVAVVVVGGHHADDRGVRGCWAAPSRRDGVRGPGSSRRTGCRRRRRSRRRRRRASSRRGQRSARCRRPDAGGAGSRSSRRTGPIRRRRSRRPSPRASSHWSAWAGWAGWAWTGRERYWRARAGAAEGRDRDVDRARARGHDRLQLVRADVRDRRRGGPEVDRRAVVEPGAGDRHRRAGTARGRTDRGHDGWLRHEDVSRAVERGGGARDGLRQASCSPRRSADRS